MDERTQEWLHKTRQIYGKPAVRGGIPAESGALKQTSLTLVAAVTIMAVLIVSPLRLSNRSAPPPQISAGSGARVTIPQESVEGKAARVVGAALPVVVIRPPRNPIGIPTVVPHVPIWMGPGITSEPSRRIPSALPPAGMSDSGPANLIAR